MQVELFPSDFLDLIDEILPNLKEKEVFLKSLKEPPQKVLRFNPFKIQGLNLPKDSQRVTWGNLAFYSDSENPSFIDDPLWQAGTYYVQEPSSLILDHVFKPKKDDLILDLCASPGGKSTLLLSKMTEDSLLISNEVVTKRIPTLKENLIRFGNGNLFITQNQGGDFGKLGEVFDWIIIDAPCSGEGLCRKKDFFWNTWSLESVKSCALRQLEILRDAANSLKVGGRLVYSTCTFNSLENEEVILNFLNEYPKFNLVQFDFPKEWKLLEKNPGTYRMLPHLVRGEGFTFTVLTKTKSSGHSVQSHSEPSKDYIQSVLKPAQQSELALIQNFYNGPKDAIFKAGSDYYAITIKDKIYLEKLFKTGFRVHQFGLFLGKMSKTKEFIPSQNLVLSGFLPPKIKKLELSLEDSLKVLHGFPLKSLGQQSKGYLILAYKSVPIAWGKNLGDRINTFYPKNFRIKKLIK